jgi:hypothetical protein
MSTPSASILVNLKVFETVSSGIAKGMFSPEILERIELSNGTSNGVACDKVYYKTETGKAASSSTDYDLAGGLTDKDGASITFAEVCLLFVRNKRSTAAAFLQVGPKAANGFGVVAAGKGFWNAALGSGGGSNVSPAMSSSPTQENSGDAFLLLYDAVGVPVVAATGDILTINCSAVVGDTNAWDIVIIGRSA